MEKKKPMTEGASTSYVAPSVKTIGIKITGVLCQSAPDPNSPEAYDPTDWEEVL